MVQHGLLQAGLEEAADRALEVDHPLAVGECQRRLAVGEPAHELIALVRQEEEEDLAEEVPPALGKACGDGVDGAGHGRDCSPRVKGARGAQPSRNATTSSTASGRSRATSRAGAPPTWRR